MVLPDNNVIEETQYDPSKMNSLLHIEIKCKMLQLCRLFGFGGEHLEIRAN